MPNPGYLERMSEPDRVILDGVVVSRIEYDLIWFTNWCREQEKLSTLIVDPTLLSGSRVWAQTMARRSRLFHAKGFRENIAWNYEDARACIVGWMNSRGHRANLMHPGIRYIGVGVAYNDRGEPYWCQRFK